MIWGEMSFIGVNDEGDGVNVSAPVAGCGCECLGRRRRGSVSCRSSRRRGKMCRRSRIKGIGDDSALCRRDGGDLTRPL